MHLPGILYKLAVRFKESHYQCYLVGGAVRDTYLGKKVKDYDLATDAYPEDVRRLFKRVIPTGIKHGTVTVLFRGMAFEVTTFRTEGRYLDGRRPESVAFTPSLEEDLSRRDFTINAMAYDLNKRKLCDPYDGKGDLKRKLIKAIGIPVHRFNEDGLRLMRACRFAAQLNYRIEAKTMRAMQQTNANIRRISAERIRDELVKILLSQHPVYGLELMRESGLLQYILPELTACHGMNQRSLHKFDVYYHSLYACEGAPGKEMELRLAALLHDIGKPACLGRNEAGEPTFYNHEHVSAEMAENILTRLKFPNVVIKKVSHLIAQHMFHYTEDWNEAAVRRFIARIGQESFPDLVKLRQADHYGRIRRKENQPLLTALIRRVEQLISRDTALGIKDLQINGKDLMNHLNLKPGKKIGIILTFLLETVLEDPALNQHEKLLEIAKKFYMEKLNLQ